MNLSLRHAFVLSFSAVLIFWSKTWMPGEIGGFATSVTVFFLLYAKSIISHRYSCTATAGLATLLLLVLSGPGLLVLARSLLLPAFLIDIFVLLTPKAISSTSACGVTAVIAFSWPVVWSLARQLFAGVSPLVAVQHSFSAFGTHAIYALVGGLPVVFFAGKTRFLTSSQKSGKK